MLASEYMKLSEEQKKRVDPMITGFNPTDMYASDHIKRVLLAFPGVFSGIGEFSIHKEFVSSKVTGHAASLHNPALDKILETIAEIGAIAFIHCDIDNVRPGEVPDHYADLMEVFKRHPNASMVWAHTGLGRFVGPSIEHVNLIDAMMSDPELGHVAADISWDLVNDYMVADEETAQAWADLLNEHPTRFLFGSDAVAPSSWEGYNKSYEILTDLWALLDKEAMHLVNVGNYERMFDESIANIRAWEKQNLNPK
ncbi:MAG: amidohydrolase family protein [Gammaproteobacteria bacterium]|nr:amidohydrolase family protein [Gammaproteobacteria bacterium]